MPYLLLVPLVATLLIISPILWALFQKMRGRKFNFRQTLLRNIAAFAVTMLAFTLMFPVGIAAEAASAIAGETDGFVQGMKYIAAGFCTSVGSVAAGIAVGSTGTAAIGAVSENEKSFSKAMIFVVLGEGIAIYGLLISILILFS